jgi:hypothetical protein
VKLIRTVVALLVVFTLFSSDLYVYADNMIQMERWPSVPDKAKYTDIIQYNVSMYKEKKINYAVGMQDYDTFGDYLNYSTFEGFKVYKLDKKGIPLVKYGDKYQYNPLMVAQYALHEYGKYFKGERLARDRFINLVDWLVEYQSDDGAFRNNFAWKHSLNPEPYEPGWVSALVQGQALSTFARAYYLTNDEKYLNAGNKALEFLTTPIEKGGVMTTLEDIDPSLKEYIFFEEYITKPNNYTLNGYMFALLGLHDWSVITEKYQLSKKNISAYYFDAGMDTLVNILPYYDIGGFSTYDLAHVVYNKAPNLSPGYHSLHIYELHALNSIYENRWLKHFENTWIKYIE